MKFVTGFVDWWRTLPREFRIPAILFVNLFALSFISVKINQREIRRTDEAQKEVRELRSLLEVTRLNCDHKVQRLEDQNQDCQTSNRQLLNNYLRSAEEARKKAERKIDQLNDQLKERQEK